jgi:beta-glucosidase
MLHPEDLAFFNGKVTTTEAGEFDVWVGTNSDEGLHGEFLYE